MQALRGKGASEPAGHRHTHRLTPSATCNNSLVQVIHGRRPYAYAYACVCDHVHAGLHSGLHAGHGDHVHVHAPHHQVRVEKEERAEREVAMGCTGALHMRNSLAHIGIHKADDVALGPRTWAEVPQMQQITSMQES